MTDKTRKKHLQGFIDKYDGVDDEDDMIKFIHKNIKDPDRTEPNPGGGTRYFYRYEGERLRTATGDNGYIFTPIRIQTPNLCLLKQRSLE